jgi:chromosome condensin MukBEF MukE localization factor
MYDMKTIVTFLGLLRESGVTNMYAASPYLYMGKERIAHQHHYDDMDESRQEKFDELLEIAEDTRRVMINGAMKHYLSKRNDDNDDEDDRYVRNVENQIRKDSTELLKLWMTMMSSRKGLK